MNTAAKRKISVRSMVYIGLFACLIAVCSWITVPGEISFTLQTMGVFLAVGLLGGRRGTAAVLVYILLGAMGAPVFSGFRGGAGALLGPTGGYIIGFLASALTMWAMEALFGRKKWLLLLSMAAGLLVCYAFGSLWFMVVYARGGGAVSIGVVLMKCVVPFILPDLAKITVAMLLTGRLERFVKV